MTDAEEEEEEDALTTEDAVADRAATFLTTTLRRPMDDAIFSRCDLHTVVVFTGDVNNDAGGRILRFFLAFCAGDPG